MEKDKQVVKTAADFNREQEEKKKREEDAKAQVEEAPKNPVVRGLTHNIILAFQRWQIYLCQQGMR